MDQKSLQDMDKEATCFVSGTLASALRLSRFGGIAPLRFVKKRNGWQVSLSRGWSYYGYFITTTIIISTILALISEMMMEQKNTIHMRTNKSRLVWILQVSLMMLIAGAAASEAPQQMRNMIGFLNQVQKINLELKINHWPTVLEGKTSYLFIVWAVAVLTFTLVDNVVSFFNSENFRLELESHPVPLNTITVLYSFYYCCYWVLQLREMQFVMITLHVKYSFTALNNSLKSLLHGTNMRTKFTNHGEIRHLALMYASICDVVRDVDRCNGFMVLIMLSSVLLHLICTPYHCITNLNDNVDKSPFHTMYVIMQLIWCTFHTFNLVMIVEPCHATHMELETTRELMGRLLRYTSSIYDPLAAELELFFRHITLNDVSYKPLKVTTMSRALVVTILGSITTYLVIIIQL